MWLLIGTTLTASFFDSLNPTAIAQYMLLLASARKKSDTWFFTMGGFLTNTLLGLAVYYGIAAQLARLLDWAAGNWPTQLYGSALLLGLGCLTVGLRLIIRTRRLSLAGAAPEAEADSPKQPAQLNPFSLFVMGVVFCLLELTSALPYFGFLALLAGYHLPFLLVLLFILLYTFVYCLPLMLLYFGYNRLHGTAAIHKLEQVLSKVSSYIIPGAVSLAGAALIWYGGPQLL
ncbi:hypothetical protein B5G12_00595 [Faecalibacterium sp. An58]|uniref:GAP family protein n=1 Tax=Faecalibacterium sp. An58 TaxID=1965648 RepID=UPI000B3A764C|nr:GAP family protein [Faecalibacterium sp. An58]OUN75605.1 hypothetical protein B5G12_00595 [Faecalibacterium sp. An58]